jgi:hypothetical protein
LSRSAHRLCLGRGARAFVVLVATLVGLGAGVALPDAQAAGPWSFTGSLGVARDLHTATLLPDGDVLVAGGRNGGPSAKAELYHPSTGTWTRTGSMGTARYWHTATLLPNGKVLVVGSYPPGTSDYATLLATLRSAELYDPATGRWSITGSMVDALYFRAVSLLPNGKVLAAGGMTYEGQESDHAELYDPATGTWAPTAPMTHVRSRATANVLPNGKALVAGGYDNPGPFLASAELYDPAKGTWAPTGAMKAPRAEAMSVTLANGKVLVFGEVALGPNGKLDKTQPPALYDPASGSWSTTGPSVHVRTFATGTLLRNGQVLVAGGNADGNTNKTATAELYDPVTNRWTATASMAVARRLHTATLLPNGKVLIASGQGVGGVRTKTAELFTPPRG